MIICMVVVIGYMKFIVINIEAYDKRSLRARIVNRLMDGEQVHIYILYLLVPNVKQLDS